MPEKRITSFLEFPDKPQILVRTIDQHIWMFTNWDDSHASEVTNNGNNYDDEGENQQLTKWQTGPDVVYDHK